MNVQVKTLKTLDELIVAYFSEAQFITGLDDINDETWGPLAKRLAVPLEHVTGYWESKTEEAADTIWHQILQRRMENTKALGEFRGNTKDRIASKALDKLEKLLDGGFIRTTDELLAVVRMTSPTAGGSVRVDIGNPAMKLADGQTLPGGDQVIHINLSPVAARNVQQPRAEREMRVIDAEMVDSTALRNMEYGAEGAEKDGE